MKQVYKATLTVRLMVIVLVVSILLFQITACSATSTLTAKYRNAGDTFDLTATAREDTIVIGKKGSGKQLESYSLQFNSPEGKDISIAYRSHIQEFGWFQWSPSGQIVASEQKSGIETLQIMLFGKDAFMYDVSYRIAVVGQDWQDWVSNGTMAGNPGQNLPIEAIEIKLELNEDYEAPTWTITEFADDSGNQAMFYTMRNNDDGTLIVIDGGYDANTSQVRSIINLFGGKVDYWFLTHYDEDHAAVFNSIYADTQGIEIGDVFCTPLDYELYLSYAVDRWWDTPWVYETFLTQTEGDERIHYLARGDSFEIDGLKVDVFNAYDQMIVEYGHPDVANMASLMIKITGEADSILFCGDVLGFLGMDLLDMYGDQLDATYVQPGHHGNNAMPIEFYDALAPKVMFFDGPAWLNESDDYTAKELINWCQENGIETYEFKTAPNYLEFN